MSVQTITLAGGCFWCLHAVYEQCDGVTEVESGYANGHVAQPSYEQVCRGDTGHAEVVRLRFDDERISLREVLEIFYAIHDPTTRNRQGNDIGPQYRSGIYWSDPVHEAIVREVSAEANAAHGGRLVTELMPLSSYWPAEAYHQRYFTNNPNQGYCAAVVAPKVEKFRRTFRARIRAA
ncbi:MAG: peptide-methionine (S)-S-oxide reductase MsrA [Burkholderiales bacterium]|nr:peptide-methionine (S)-S-oxide reductase MsrA [Burkholderiales bacterium]